MKKVIAFVMLVATLAFIGCATTDKPEVVEAVGEIAARNLGFQVAQGSPELAGKILVYMDGMDGMNDDMLLAATEMGVGYLINHFEGNPQSAAMMKADAMTLLKLFGLSEDTIDLQGVDVERVKPILEAFRRGVEIAGS